MFLKDHKQKMALGRWLTRREQRCLTCAIVIIIVVIFGIYEHPTWPRSVDLRLETTRPYMYTSSPEAGMPNLPFKNSSKRKANRQPWWEFWDEDDDAELR